MMYPFFDWTFIILIPGIILATYAQIKVVSTFNKYSKVPSKSGLRAVDAAYLFLKNNGLSHIDIYPVGGSLTDHYDPVNERLGLSESVYNSTSIAALAVAAHEVGHAIQHKEHYLPILIRNSILPLANFGSSLSWIFLIIGFIIHSMMWIKLGIILFSFAVAFQVVTLPVEFDASRRGLQLLVNEGVLASDEVPKAKKVLTAAALTYVASALVAILELLRLILISRDE